MKRSKFSWSNLPSELILSISECIKTRQGLLNFRAVCKEWHRLISISRIWGNSILSPILPHKISMSNDSPLLKGSTRNSIYKEAYNSILLVASSIFVIKPIENDHLLIPPWLITVDEVNPGKLSLRKPFSRYGLKNMPENFKKIYLDNFDVKEMGRVYSLRFNQKCCNVLVDDYKFSRLFEEDHKVVLLGETRSKIDDCTAVVLYDNGTLAVIKLRDEKVEEVSSKVVKKFDDIVVFNGMVYAIDRRGRLYLMDKCSNNDRFMLSNIIQDPLKPGGERNKTRLVESCGELYLVHKFCASRPSFEQSRLVFQVYMLNQEKNSWDEINSIGNDRILFVTPDCCFFASVADFCGRKGNCIVTHSKYSFSSHTRVPPEDNQDYSDYKLRGNWDEQNIEVFHFEDFKFTSVKDAPHYSDVFWPPPPWILPNTYPPRVRFEGLYIRAELIPTLEAIWAKYGNLIGPDTIRTKTVAYALEELAQLVINLKYRTAGKIYSPTLVDFKLKGIEVEWLTSIIDKGMMLHNNKSIMESVTRLDRDIAKLEERKRALLAQSAKLKEELKEDIDLDEFFEKVLQ